MALSVACTTGALTIIKALSFTVALSYYQSSYYCRITHMLLKLLGYS